ncbi:hypothetical protein [Aquincola sp. J276]|uniref:preprotein translocase subunit SecA n=1 Tax=Aquincola sp. J276 TaxID=2898432 RepID=UPI002151D905|nr:hypothetical protein [Aquincola sp. J276]MCR5864429.1 hypothetical protein [Aquincola sp. J276]
MARTLLLDVPDLAPGAWPERRDRPAKALDALARVAWSALRTRLQPPLAGLRRIAGRTMALREAMRALDDEALRARLARVAPAAARDLQPGDLAAALAAVREGAWRALGKEPFDTQLMGAAGLLSGRLVEMRTGEGKTLTAGLAACLAGAAGLPVHVITVNDYLAERDAEEMQGLFDFFHLRCGVVVHDRSPQQKVAAYACEITYCTGKDLVFDYLRDRVSAGGGATRAQLATRALAGQGGSRLMQRGLHFAIVDEADSVLIDEAKTPLILAEKGDPLAEPQAFHDALAVADTLAAGTDFHLDGVRRELRLLPPGKERLRKAAAGRAGLWASARGREHFVTQALRARHLFLRDQQYLVAEDGSVQIIDEYTGRVLAGRTWEQGLHQMIEAKEGSAISSDNRTLARITYQRFFCRYLRLGGMTGTAREMSAEARRTYGLETVTIPPHRTPRRVAERLVLCQDEAAKWQAVVQAVRHWQQAGRPVLVGTRSLEASEALSAVLAAAGIEHQVLNARQDQAEADIIGQAGQAGTVTVATNMAGRGTDIRLGPGVDTAGGLGVVLTEFHESARIDRQLIGRCARQGDAGGTATVVAADDALFGTHALARRLVRWAGHGRPVAVLQAPGVATTLAHRRDAALLDLARRLAQGASERRHARTRRDNLKQDRALDTQLAFAGNQI